MSLAAFNGCLSFTPKLVEVYKKLKELGENFYILMIPLDDDEESFKQEFANLPWFSLPLEGQELREAELSELPTLVIISPDGKALHSNVAEAIEEHDIQAYPFTPERFAKLEKIEKANREAQTLESILVSGDRDFVIGKDGAKVRYLCLLS